MRKNRIAVCIILFAISLAALSGCFSPFRGDEGNLVIRIGDGANRAALGEPTTRAFSHTITVSGGPGGPHVRTGVKTGQAVHMNIAPGTWTITVEARLGTVLRAEKTETHTIRSGHNQVPILMNVLGPGLYKVENGVYTLETDNITALDDDLGLINGNPGDYVLLTKTMDGVPTVSCLDETSGPTTLIIQGYDTDAVLTKSGPNEGRMFTVGENAALTLDHITLRGPVRAIPDPATEETRADNNEALVVVTDGTLIMNEGSVITGNANWNFGGGVYIEDGRFIMNGGLITKNKAGNEGGGVYMADGEFTMNGEATISDNAAISHDGGGVYMAGGDFIMNKGRIYHNTARAGSGVYMTHGEFTMNGEAAISDNTAASQGGGVYMTGGTFTMKGEATISHNTATNGNGGGVCVRSGTFTMEGGEIGGNTAAGRGGGVCNDGGTFEKKSGGTIYGSGDGDDNNTATQGGVAVYANGTNTINDQTQEDTTMSIDYTLDEEDTILSTTST